MQLTWLHTSRLVRPTQEGFPLSLPSTVYHCEHLSGPHLYSYAIVPAVLAEAHRDKAVSLHTK